MKDRSDDPSHQEQTLLPRVLLEGYVLFQDIFILRLYVIGHRVNDKQDSKRGNLLLLLHGLLFQISKLNPRPAIK